MTKTEEGLPAPGTVIDVWSPRTLSYLPPRFVGYTVQGYTSTGILLWKDHVGSAQVDQRCAWREHVEEQAP